MRVQKTKATVWVRWLTAIVAVVCAGVGYGFAWRTFVPWWELVAMALGLGIAIGLWIKGATAKLLLLRNVMLSFAVSAVVMTAVSYGAMLSLNYCLADKESAHEEVAVVTSKFSEERTRYRRLSRNRTVPSGKYKVYNIRVCFENGAERNMPVNVGTYTRTRVGAKKHFTVTKGFLGYDVFRSDE